MRETRMTADKPIHPNHEPLHSVAPAAHHIFRRSLLLFLLMFAFSLENSECFLYNGSVPHLENGSIRTVTNRH